MWDLQMVTMWDCNPNLMMILWHKEGICKSKTVVWREKRMLRCMLCGS